MKVKNSNRSSIKTKKIIKTKFAELLKEKKELNKITVSELVEKADINRSTFYLHYDSIYGVAEEFEAEFIQNLMLDTQNLTSITDLNLYFDNIIEYLKENEEIYRMLLSSTDSLFFLKKLSNLINEKIYTALSSSPNIHKSRSLKFDISFFTNGIINQVLQYFTENIEYSLDDISRYMKKYFQLLFL